MHLKRLNRTGRLNRDMPVIVPLPNEEWRQYRDTDYEVSSLGRVRRGMWTEIVGRTWPGREVDGSADTCGYLRVRPFPRPDRTMVAIHRMVAETYLGPAPTGMEVNHIDGDRTNNAARNLEYVTHRENVRHAWELGNVDRRGEKNGRAKLTEADVKAIRSDRAAGVSPTTLARRYRVGRTAIFDIIARRSWQHVS